MLYAADIRAGRRRPIHDIDSAAQPRWDFGSWLGRLWARLVIVTIDTCPPSWHHLASHDHVARLIDESNATIFLSPSARVPRARYGIQAAMFRHGQIYLVERVSVGQMPSIKQIVFWSSCLNTYVSAL